MNALKIRISISLVICVLGIWINVYFSTYLHQLLSHEWNGQINYQFGACIISLWTHKQHMMLFLCQQGFVLLIAIAYVVLNNKPYQSDLTRVTPDLSTPVKAGQTQFGSARWMNEREIDQAFNSYNLKINDQHMKRLVGQANDDISCKTDEVETNEDDIPYIKQGGIVLGKKFECDDEKIYFVDEDTHTLCIGATRCGKTRTIVLQSIATLGLAGESMIISDPKGELYEYTYPFLEREGYEVIAIDFKNPLKSNRYNFLQTIIDAVDDGNIPSAIEATWDITAQLVGEPKGERIWADGEASIIASAIMAVVYDNQSKSNRRYQNMTNVYYFVANMCKSVNGTMPIIEYMNKLKSTHPSKGLLAISEIAPSKTRSSFYTAALTTLRLFTNPLIQSMTCTSDYDIKSIGKKKSALFIILPDEKTTYYSLASLLVSQHYELLVKAADERGGRLENRVNFVLDEFGNFLKIMDFSTKLTVGGGRGIRFNLFLQSFAQLDEKYGKEVARIIKGNCETWIYLQAEDLETLEEISKKLGNYTVSTYSLSSNHAKFSTPSSSQSINLTARALLAPDEIRRISRPYSLVISRNNPAIMYAPDLSKWYFNKIFGLGDKEHNRKVRESRNNKRQVREVNNFENDLWNIWIYFIAMCENPEGMRQTGNKKDSDEKIFYKEILKGGAEDDLADK